MSSARSSTGKCPDPLSARGTTLLPDTFDRAGQDAGGTARQLSIGAGAAVSSTLHGVDGLLDSAAPARSLIDTGTIAIRLGIQRGEVRRRLLRAGVAPNATRPASGQSSLAWPVGAVLRVFGSPIANLARRRGYRSAEDYLCANDTPLPYSPPKRFVDLAARHQREAEKWRTALAESLRRKEQLAGDLVAHVARECRAVFGREIGERTWRRR
jgi:hypothetical protein